jgi:hypothetical protein
VATWKTVQKICARLPETEEGTPALMVCVRLKSASEQVLREVLTDAWRMKAPPKVRKDHPEV